MAHISIKMKTELQIIYEKKVFFLKNILKNIFFKVTSFRIITLLSLLMLIPHTDLETLLQSAEFCYHWSLELSKAHTKNFRCSQHFLVFYTKNVVSNLSGEILKVSSQYDASKLIEFRTGLNWSYTFHFTMLNYKSPSYL